MGAESDHLTVPAVVSDDRRVGRDILQNGHHSGGTQGDGDSVDSGSFGAQAEMPGQFALSQEMTPRTYLYELPPPTQARCDLKIRTHSISVGSLSAFRRYAAQTATIQCGRKVIGVRTTSPCNPPLNPRPEVLRAPPAGNRGTSVRPATSMAKVTPTSTSFRQVNEKSHQPATNPVSASLSTQNLWKH